MRFTKRGLIYKTKNSYCTTWEDLFEVENRDSYDKKKRFKSKYKDLIKEAKYTISIGDEETRTYNYMVAHWDLTGDKKSDLQKIAFEQADPFIMESSDKKFGNSIKKRLYNRVCILLAEMIEYQWDGLYGLVDGMIVDMTTGEVKFGDKYILASITDGINWDKKKERYCGFRKVDEWGIAFNIIISMKLVLDGKHTFLVEDKEESYSVEDGSNIKIRENFINFSK